MDARGFPPRLDVFKELASHIVPMKKKIHPIAELGQKNWL